MVHRRRRRHRRWRRRRRGGAGTRPGTQGGDLIASVDLALVTGHLARITQLQAQLVAATADCLETLKAIAEAEAEEDGEAECSNDSCTTPSTRSSGTSSGKLFAVGNPYNLTPGPAPHGLCPCGRIGH